VRKERKKITEKETKSEIWRQLDIQRERDSAKSK